MNSKKKGLPTGFDKSFKGLPVTKRIRVLFIAKKLLKVQRENRDLLGKEGEVDEGGRR